MNSNFMKFIVILSAILFIGSGVAWADGYRGKGPKHGRGKGHYSQKWNAHKAHPRLHQKRLNRHYRKPYRPYRFYQGYRHKFPKRPFYRSPKFRHFYPKHRYHRPGYRGSHYSFGFSIFEPNVAFGFGVKGHK